MGEDYENPERYRITGTVPWSDDHPGFTFQSEMYTIFTSEDLEMVKRDALAYREFFGLNKWQIQIMKTRDQWELVTFDD